MANKLGIDSMADRPQTTSQAQRLIELRQRKARRSGPVSAQDLSGLLAKGGTDAD
jgi:hypothetical protein